MRDLIQAVAAGRAHVRRCVNSLWGLARKVLGVPSIDPLLLEKLKGWQPAASEAELRSRVRWVERLLKKSSRVRIAKQFGLLPEWLELVRGQFPARREIALRQFRSQHGFPPEWLEPDRRQFPARREIALRLVLYRLPIGALLDLENRRPLKPQLDLENRHHTPPDRNLFIHVPSEDERAIYLPFELEYYPHDALLGVVIREVLRADGSLKDWKEQSEEQVDQVAIEQGFEEEILALRKFHEDRGPIEYVALAEWILYERGKIQKIARGQYCDVETLEQLRRFSTIVERDISGWPPYNMVLEMGDGFYLARVGTEQEERPWRQYAGGE